MDLVVPRQVAGVVTQARKGHPHWVSNYLVQTSMDGSTFANDDDRFYFDRFRVRCRIGIFDVDFQYTTVGPNDGPPTDPLVGRGTGIATVARFGFRGAPGIFQGCPLIFGQGFFDRKLGFRGIAIAANRKEQSERKKKSSYLHSTVLVRYVRQSVRLSEQHSHGLFDEGSHGLEKLRSESTVDHTMITGQGDPHAPT